MDEGMQRCQRCGAMAWDWLCWTHWEEYCAEAEKAEAEAEAEARFAEVRDRLLDAELVKAERRLSRKGWY
jgi:hypothetical protein